MQTIQPNYEKEMEIEEKWRNQPPKQKGIPVFWIIIAVFVIGCIILACVLTLGKREATNKDIKITNSQSTLTEYTFNVTPHKDISDLVLKIELYDKNDAVIAITNKYVGNVEIDKTYKVRISITEFSFSTVLNGSYLSVNVKSGKTKLV